MSNERWSRMRKQAVASATPQRAGPAAAIDPLSARVRQWISSQKDSVVAVREWQELEHQLSLKAKSLGIALDDAMRLPWPEVRAMRDLMRRIRAQDRQLALAARKILRSDSPSADGAIAKIQLALRMRQPTGDDGEAWCLVQSGYDELIAHRHERNRPD